MKVLLSIKPEYVEQIENGNKKFEYRKRIFKKNVDSVVVYSTKPVGKIVGEIIIEEIINDSPEEIWNKTNKYSGISEENFKNYFSNRKEGFAIKIKKFLKYDKPLNPFEIFNDFVPPQSYKYIER
ncbi:MAG: ASCH domain-containing protein [Bacillaceae bacterium]|nr:ASCH domain-containing protein [Bacillaceae bacterium]